MNSASEEQFELCMPPCGTAPRDNVKSDQPDELKTYLLGWTDRVEEPYEMP